MSQYPPNWQQPPQSPQPNSGSGYPSNPQWPPQPNAGYPSGPQWPPQSPSQPLPPQQQYTQYPQHQLPPSYLPQYPQQRPFGQPPGPIPPKKKFSRRMWILIGVIVLILVVASAAAGSGKSSTSPTIDATPTQAVQNQSVATTAPQPTNTPAPTPKPTVSYTHFEDGTYQVGKDIQPGTYRTRTNSPGCYYARLRGFGGTVDDIIANANTDDSAIITIQASDKGFESQNCGTWTKDLSQITSSKTSFDGGIYFVGTDIQPGTYKNSGGSGCYFARLSGFGNTVDDIISNNNVNSPAIVTIAASDKGFQSSHCGTWKKL